VPKFTQPAIHERRPIDACTVVIFLDDCLRSTLHPCHVRQRHANRQTVNLSRIRGRGRPLDCEYPVDTNLILPRLMFQLGNRTNLSIAKANVPLDSAFMRGPARFPARAHEGLNLLVRHPYSDAVRMPTPLRRPGRVDKDNPRIGFDGFTSGARNQGRADERQSADFPPSTKFRHSKRLMKPPPSTRLPFAAS